MKVILIYDIETIEPADQKRLNNIRKIARKYLYHVQKSVFEGDLTESQLYKLEREVLEVIDEERDSVIIYKLPDGIKWERRILARKRVDFDSNIL